MLQGTGCSLFDTVAGSGTFWFNGRIECVQNMAGMKFHRVQIRLTLRGQISVNRCDLSISNSSDKKPDIAWGVSPVRHDMAEMQVSRNRFDLRRHDGAIFECTRDPHGTAGVERKTAQIL